MAETTIAVIQMASESDEAKNLDRAESLIREAAVEEGAQVVVLPELFSTPYFCQEESSEHFRLARPASGNLFIERFARLAGQHRVVMPFSFFEKSESGEYFNSVAVIDADGTVLGVYRKSHIPHNPGYFEKRYFTPGDKPPQVWGTRYGRIGIGICWDQWFPEAARLMVLAGADLLLYPSTIGTEPADPDYDSFPAWRHTMQGHAAANVIPVAAANRIGVEAAGTTRMTFYGRSFISDQQGSVVASLNDAEGIAVASFDLDAIRTQRSGWNVLRDRRPDLYGPRTQSNED
jgi:N-carbamoylputrescine amidase